MTKQELTGIPYLFSSLERIQGYIKIEQEPKPTEAGKPPAYWPASGEISAEKLSARYSPDGPKVLHDISFHIKAGERVGVGKLLLHLHFLLLAADCNLQLVVRGLGR